MVDPEERMARRARRRFLHDAGGLAIVVTGAVLALYGATLPHLHYPDAAAYVEQVMEGQLYHPHHLLYNWFGALMLGLFGAPDPLRSLQWVNAAAGAVGCGLFSFLLAVATRRLVLPALLAVVLALTYGWWSLAIVWEAHTLPVVFMLGVLGMLLVGRPGPLPHGALVGLLHALAILFHQTMVLAVPGVLLALVLRPADRARRLFAYAVTGAVLVVGAYGFAHQSAAGHGKPGGDVADFVLRDARLAKPPVDASRRFEILTRGWGTVVAASRVRYCANVDVTLASGPLTPAQLERRARELTLAASVLAGFPLVLALVPTARRFPGPTALTFGWTAAAVPFVAWWEPGNYEYYVGITAGLLFWSGLGWSTLLDRAGSRVRGVATTAVVLAWTALGVLLLRHQWEMEMATASASTPPHDACRESGPGGGEGAVDADAKELGKVRDDR